MTKEQLDQAKKLSEKLSDIEKRHEQCQKMLLPENKHDYNFKISYNSDRKYHEVYLTKRGREAVADAIIMMVASITEKEYKEVKKEFDEFTGTRGNKNNEKE